MKNKKSNDYSRLSVHQFQCYSGYWKANRANKFIGMGARSSGFLKDFPTDLFLFSKHVCFLYFLIFVQLASRIYSQAKIPPRSRRERSWTATHFLIFVCLFIFLSFQSIQHKRTIFFLFRKSLTCLRGIRFNQPLDSYNLCYLVINRHHGVGFTWT